MRPRLPFQHVLGTVARTSEVWAPSGRLPWGTLGPAAPGPSVSASGALSGLGSALQDRPSPCWLRSDPEISQPVPTLRAPCSVCDVCSCVRQQLPAHSECALGAHARSERGPVGRVRARAETCRSSGERRQPRPPHHAQESTSLPVHQGACRVAEALPVCYLGRDMTHAHAQTCTLTGTHALQQHTLRYTRVQTHALYQHEHSQGHTHMY